MFHQVNVEVLGIVENMSQFTCPHCGEVIDIFSKGGVERMTQQFKLPFLGSVELDPNIRHGGDRGLPVALDGEDVEQVEHPRVHRAPAAAVGGDQPGDLSPGERGADGARHLSPVVGP